MNRSPPLTFLGYALHRIPSYFTFVSKHIPAALSRSSVHHEFPRVHLGESVRRARLKPIASLIIHILLLFDNYLTGRACEARGGRRLAPSYTSPGFIFSHRDEQVSLETRLMCGEVTGAAASPETQPQSLHILQK